MSGNNANMSRACIAKAPYMLTMSVVNSDEARNMFSLSLYKADMSRAGISMYMRKAVRSYYLYAKFKLLLAAFRICWY